MGDLEPRRHLTGAGPVGGGEGIAVAIERRRARLVEQQGDLGKDAGPERRGETRPHDGLDDACLRKLVEKATPAQLEELRAAGWLKAGQPVWYNAGIYIFKPLVFEYTSRLQKSVRGEYELTDAIRALALSDRYP